MGTALKVVAAVGVAGAVACCGGGYWLYRTVNGLGVDKKTYDSLAVGAAQPDVTAKLPKRAEASIASDPHAKPAGATCTYYLKGVLEDANKSYIYRFCFVDGKLAEKKQILDTDLVLGE